MVITAQNPRPNILLVDDKSENLLALENVLKRDDTHILTARSGNEALAILLEHDCAVTLMDVQMPDMDGFETASLIRQNRKTRNVPIIFVTAINKEEQYVSRGYDLGAVDYLFKPLQPSVVQAKVNVFLEIYKQGLALDVKATELEKINAELSQANSQFEISHREIQRLNDELGRSNLELDQFAAIASHDLQEPLRMIRSYTNLLQKRLGGKLDAKSGEYMDFVVDGAKRMRDLIEAILDYSKVGREGVKAGPVDVAGAMRAAVLNLERKIGKAKATIEVGPLPTVVADPVLLTQLLQNLVSNALKFKSKDRAAVVAISAHEAEREWEFAVADNGIGIRAEDTERIFALFQRLHTAAEYPGAGIGLATCRKIVERHGWRLWVESVVDVGTTFFFSLPKP